MLHQVRSGIGLQYKLRKCCFLVNNLANLCWFVLFSCSYSHDPPFRLFVQLVWHAERMVQPRYHARLAPTVWQVNPSARIALLVSYFQTHSIGQYCPTASVAPLTCSGTGTEQFSYIGQTACSQCPAGYECPHPSLPPVECNKGYYSIQGDTKCTRCPAGSSCAKKSVAPVACASGQYAEEGATYCSICPLGYYCTSKTAKPIECLKGSFAPQGSAACQTCPLGKFCPSTKVPAPLSCAPGYFTPRVNQQSCTPCPAGFECSDPTKPPTPCTEGYFSFGLASACTQCPAGYYCPYNTKEPIICQKPTYSLAGQSECKDCIEGYNCLHLNTETQSVCPAGQYRVNDGSNPVCKTCPNGHYCPSTTSSPLPVPVGAYTNALRTTVTVCPSGSFCTPHEVIACPDGTYVTSTSNRTYCMSCPLGYYCPTPTTVGVPLTCPAGTYNNVGNQTACLDCPAGYMCIQGSTAPVLCPLGYYSGTKQQSCFQCEPGFQCPAQLSQFRTACPSGMVSYYGSTHCFYCPIGKKCAAAPANHIFLRQGEPLIENCPVGQISDEGQLTCTPCPKGFACYSQDTQGKVACSTGFYSLDGELACKACPPGSKCPMTDGTTITQCGAGTFSPKGSSSCMTCPKGFQCPFTHLAYMERCPAGTYSLGSQQMCTVCPEHYECPHRDSLVKLKDGYMSPAGTSVALKCRAGWECKHVSVDNSYVRPCELGWYSETGSSACTICPIGYYCPLQDHSPIICPEGYYSDQTGQVQCIRCAVGTQRSQASNLQCTTISPGRYALHPWLTSQECLYGSYMSSAVLTNQNILGCQTCDPGYICMKGEISSQPSTICPVGFFCNHQSEQNAYYAKFPCPSGMYATGNTGSKTRGEACQICPAGSYCEGSNRTAYACMPGYYCPKGTNRSSEYPCPAGTYQPLYSQVSEIVCLTCTIGNYCPRGSASPIPCSPGNICPFTGLTQHQEIACSAGSYQGNKGQIACNACPKGGYCPSGSVNPMLCPPGTYNDLDGQKYDTDCKQCPKNNLCAVFGLTSLASLPSTEWGFLSPTNSKYAQELTCPPGTWDTVFNLINPDQCALCPEGFACEPGASQNMLPVNKVKCEPGHYCPKGTVHERQYPCPGGSYSASENLVAASQCLQCPAGFYCPPGSYQPWMCPNGYYCIAGTENFQHSPCKNGTYSLAKGLKAATECLPCPKGYFCKEHTVPFPEKCPPGTYNDQLNAYLADNSVDTITTSCRLCSEGMACYNGTVNQRSCPIGTYAPIGSSDCFPCKEGYDCSASTGLGLSVYRSMNLCPAGYYCNGKVKQACPVGYFCPANTRRQYPCPVGTFSTTTTNKDLTECIATPAGYYTSQIAQTSYNMNLCALGYSCPLGSHHQFAYKCPRGTYSNTAGATTCKTCDAGSYCNETSVLPIICPQGYYCQAGSYEPLKCPVGTFGSQLGYKLITDCQKCLPGQYCSQAGLQAPDGLCDPGYYCKEGAKVPNPTDGVTGDVCQEGGFCEYGSKRVKECPPGTYNPKKKGKTQTDCVACLPGYYCKGSNLPNPSGQCQAGYYCPAGSTVPKQQPSPPGSFSLAGQSSATPCAKGTYNPFTAKAACLPCKAGFYCDEEGISDGIKDCPRGSFCIEGVTTYSKCPIGTYMNQYNAKASADCKSCLAGKYCATDGLIDPTGDCEQGYYCLSGAQIATPEVENVQKTYGPCPKGFYCPASTSYPIPCPPGTFSNEMKAYSIQTCLKCTAGSYCALSGLAQPQDMCDEGFYCPEGSVSSRPPLNYCLAGQYCPKGSGLATVCAAGTYQPQPYQSTCITCPPGYFCEEGASSYTTNICPTGNMCPLGTQYSAQYPCQPGFYQPFTGQKICLPCDTGKYCNQQGLTTPSGDCQAGYYCKSGSSTDTPSLTDQGGLCPKGFYCPAGSGMPRPCPPGKYCDQVAKAEASGNCAAGYYCTNGATKQKPVTPNTDGGSLCPPGFYCPEGSFTPLPCAPGKYNPNYQATSEASCTPCKAGMYCESSGLSQPTGFCSAGYSCPAGQKSPKPDGLLCPKGSQCPSGSTQAIACAGDTFQDLIGQSTCKLCPAGFQCTLTTQTLCKPNFYCPANKLDAIPCPSGKFTSSYNASLITDCIPCLPGMYCITASNTVTVSPCKAGFYCKSGASSDQGTAPCPAGYYCPARSAAPRPCSPGKYCSKEKLTAPEADCDAGYYCSKGSKLIRPLDGVQGNICPRGYYCPAGTISPIACPIGTYSDKTGQVAVSGCITCTAGFLCNKRGLTTYTGTCPAGFFCKSANEQTPCPEGYYCPLGIADKIKCESGYYQPNTQQSKCLICPEGFYCSNTNPILAVACTAGSYCEAGTDTPKLCPMGTYNPFQGSKSIIDCISCQEGMYCATTGLSAPTGQCQAGYYCKSGATSANPLQGSLANSCEPGKYCPAGSAYQQDCPVGTYSDKYAGQSGTDCLKCPTGYYCPYRGQTSSFYGFLKGDTNYACGDGFQCVSGAMDVNPTPDQGGALCTEGNTCIKGQAKPCAIGSYQPNKGIGKCLFCPAGKLCDTTAMTEAGNCPPGFYCPLTDDTKLGDLSKVKLQCPAGTYSPQSGNQLDTQCTKCKEGQYCTGGLTTTSGTCQSQFYCALGSSLPTPSTNVYTMGSTQTGGQCPQGFYCPAGTTAPIPCPLGTFQPNSQSSSCLPCPLGSFCNELGITGQTIVNKKCTAGYLCLGSAVISAPTDGITGRKCAPGNYCPSGTTVEIACPAGTYEHRTGSSECQICLPGHICPVGSKEPKPCPQGYYCPNGVSDPVPCTNGRYGHTTKLQAAEQCAYCPPGKYCQFGFIQANCQAGFYCDQGATSSTDFDKLCPESHYCPSGTTLPIKCPNGGTTFSKGAKNSTECQTCKEGFYCVENGNQQYACPKGFYCPAGQDIKACPKYTYNALQGQYTIRQCLSCPIGYFCNDTGLSTYTASLCPAGYYCQDTPTSSPAPCPAGTYNQEFGAESVDDCEICPEGSYCPKATINPIACNNGTYCPAGSALPKSCQTGNYCPAESSSMYSCPGAFKCTNTGIDLYSKCQNGTYCSLGSSGESQCPSGTFGSSNPKNTDVSSSCTTCEPGTYSISGTNECKTCPEGYVCLGGTTSATPNQPSQNGYICPAGYYCPTGSSQPKSCSKGMYLPTQGSSNVAQCKACPEGTYGDAVGLTVCKSCGGSSKALTGSESCLCVGLNRIYLRDTKQCVCKSGYEPSDNSNGNIDSTVDCQEKIYERCGEGQEQDQYGKCKSLTDCSKECDGGNGKIQSGIGICQCDNAKSADDVCNAACREKSKTVSFTSDGQIQITDPTTKTTTTTKMLAGVEGDLKCSQKDASSCQLVSLGKNTQSGDFTADYSLPKAVQNSKRVLSEKLSNMTRLLQSNSSSENYIKNPVICLPQGSALLFEGLSSKHYPVYARDSLVNTNPNFDYSKFTLLGEKLQNQTNVTAFVYTFDQSGIYVFSDSNNSAKQTLVAVMAPSQQCPQNLIYSSMTQANLLKVGISLKKGLVYTPDWGFFIGACLAILALIVMSVFALGYVYRKSWKSLSTLKDIAYQQLQSEHLAIEHPEEDEAIISINAEKESFKYLNHGKEVIRTKEQLRQKRKDDKALKDKKKKRVVELEEVEDLKERLNQHLSEIKKLLGRGDPGDEEDNKNESDNLITELSRLRQLIDDQRKLLEGEELDEYQREQDEREKKEREEEEKKVKEEKEKLAREAEYTKLEASIQKAEEEALERKKDSVLNDFENQMDIRKKDLLNKFKHLGVDLDPEAKAQLLQNFDANLGKIGAMLEEDEQSQNDLLKRRLEERKRRRQKAQGKLDEAETNIKVKEQAFKDRKQEVEDTAKEQTKLLEADLAKERLACQRDIEDDLERQKMERLDKFEDLIKEAKAGNDMTKVLNQYQQASTEVDHELMKERRKQEDDLEKRLKGRRGQRKAQIEMDKAEQIKTIERDQAHQLEKDKRDIEELRTIIKSEEGSKQVAQVIDRSLEKIKQQAATETDAQMELKNGLKQKTNQLLEKIKQGLMTKLDKLIHEHQQEKRDFDRRMISEAKALDQEVEKAKAQLQPLLDRKQQLQQDLSKAVSSEDKAKLLQELTDVDTQLQKQLDFSNASQDSLLQQKLKERKLKRQALAEQERAMKNRQQQDLNLELALQTQVEQEKKAVLDKANLDTLLRELKLQIPSEELPYAVNKALEVKHAAEFDDLLVKLFEEKCKALQCEIFSMLEEKLHKEAVLKKDFQDKSELLQKAGQTVKLEELKLQHEKELQDLDWAYRQKEAQLEKELTSQLMDQEQAKIMALKEAQLEEKRDVFDQHLPQSMMKDLEVEIQEEERQELEHFRKEMEEEKLRKLRELEEQQRVIQREMQEHRARLEKMQNVQERLDQENARMQRAQQLRKKRGEAAQQSEFIEKLKRELMKVNAELDSVIGQEKARQLQQMQAAMELKLKQAEELQAKEQAELKLREEEEKRESEKEAREALERQELMDKVREVMKEQSRFIEKKCWAGSKIETISDYYTLHMRKKEQDRLSMYQTQAQKRSSMSNTLGLAHQVTTQSLGLFDQNVNVSKEQQLKLLSDILLKIETMEGSVKGQLAKHQQATKRHTNSSGLLPRPSRR